MTLSIAFRCKACGAEADPPRRDAREIAGFGRCASWLARHPFEDEHAPPLMEDPPSAGRDYWLAVAFPFMADAGAPFWLLYRPPDAHLNGWEDQPQAIPRSALVECALLDVAWRDEVTGFVHVACLRSVAVAAIGETLPEVSGGTALDLLDSARTQVTRWQNFTHLSANIEGDVGAWALVERRADVDVLVLEGDWSWHRDSFLAANRPISIAEAALYARIVDRQASRS